MNAVSLKQIHPTSVVLRGFLWSSVSQDTTTNYDPHQALVVSAMREEVAAHTVGDLRQLLVALVSTYRCDGEEIDVGVARSEAKTNQAFTANPPNEFARALRTAIRCIISPHKYYVKVLRRAICSKNTDEDALTLVVVMHAERI
ncbi:hypothetical protein ZIOFF_053005 [Zingiber officinale]|uniref:Uncharacterized protein n=1 Tax=Zingiber officinale TaxID=94328 RepID=A0A8J5KCN2_ZINOF|nr:hypothetical protein ZIOFF_053005 [Zingiber officinale]